MSGVLIKVVAKSQIDDPIKAAGLGNMPSNPTDIDDSQSLYRAENFGAALTALEEHAGHNPELLEVGVLPHTYEIAWMDPLPLDPTVPGHHDGGRTAFRGGDWSSYRYSGYIYESDARRRVYIWKVPNASRAAGGPRLSWPSCGERSRSALLDTESLA